MIKSKERISEFGEVFTSEREVNAMLDLVKDETQRIDSRFFEPACGDGNFLIEVLSRKIDVVRRGYSKSQLDFERYTFTAIASLYGIDIMLDNVEQCRARLYNYVYDVYLSLYKKEASDKFLKSIYFVLTKNIIHGDALSLQLPNSGTPIVFSEWSFALGSKVRRIEYTLNNLLAYQPFEGDSLFSDLGEEVFLPHPLTSHPLVHFREVANAAD